MIKIGPASLDSFEDRVLYYLVDLAGLMPVPLNSGILEGDLAAQVATELGITPELAKGDKFRRSDAFGPFMEALRTLERDGMLEMTQYAGPGFVRPTRNGRSRVIEWRKRWDELRQAQERQIVRRILEELDQQRRVAPETHKTHARVNVDNLCSDFGINTEEYLAIALRLKDQGKIAQNPVEQAGIDEGYASITEAGIQSLTVGPRPQPNVEEAWNEVARLKRRLQIAERDLPSLITDEELRRRCTDILTAEGDYDRVIREACVILENRVRTLTKADATLVGVSLMQRAFSPKNGPLQLSPVEQEQVGAMNIYAGVMALFRNKAGHHIVDNYSQEDALRFVIWIDLLLSMLAPSGTS